MELSQLRYFIAVAKLGNMSKAAETLFVSQPNLSTSISRLEEEVGVPLFERRRGKIALNQNGELLLKSVEQAVSLLDAGVQAVPEPTQRTARAPLHRLHDGRHHPPGAFSAGAPRGQPDPPAADLPNVTSLLDRCEVDLGHDGAPAPVGRGGL